MPVRDPLLSQCNDLPAPELPKRGESWACFLDVDGTLLELAETPDDVTVPPALVARLDRLHTLLGGALALVSGRPLGDIDRLFAPLRLPAAGVHGAELRLDDGSVRHVAFDPERLDPVREAFDRFVGQHGGTLAEDKRCSVTLHFRQRPDLAAEVHQLGATLIARLGDELHLLEGKMVLEIRGGAATKGTAVEAFLREIPFAGRRPVYLGDDRTDEDAFRVVRAAGGVSVVVGTPESTAATSRLADVAAVHRWLDALATTLQRDA